MISNFKFKISNCQTGITLIEIIIVVFIIALFSSIAFLNFPKIQGSFALSSAAYELAQNIRTAENMALSGVTNAGGSSNAAGYGVFIDLSDASRSTKSYKIYADTCPTANPFNLYCDITCSSSCGGDHVINNVDIDRNNPGVSMTVNPVNLDGSPKSISINFMPPNPKINIDGMSEATTATYIEIKLFLDADPSQQKIVSVNTSGLIQVK